MTTEEFAGKEKEMRDDLLRSIQEWGCRFAKKFLVSRMMYQDDRLIDGYYHCIIKDVISAVDSSVYHIGMRHFGAMNQIILKASPIVLSKDFSAGDTYRIINGGKALTITTYIKASPWNSCFENLRRLKLIDSTYRNPFEYIPQSELDAGLINQELRDVLVGKACWLYVQHGHITLPQDNLQLRVDGLYRDIVDAETASRLDSALDMYVNTEENLFDIPPLRELAVCDPAFSQDGYYPIRLKIELEFQKTQTRITLKRAALGNGIDFNGRKIANTYWICEDSPYVLRNNDIRSRFHMMRDLAQMAGDMNPVRMDMPRDEYVQRLNDYRSHEIRFWMKSIRMTDGITTYRKYSVVDETEAKACNLPDVNKMKPIE